MLIGLHHAVLWAGTRSVSAWLVRSLNGMFPVRKPGGGTPNSAGHCPAMGNAHESPRFTSLGDGEIDAAVTLWRQFSRTNPP